MTRKLSPVALAVAATLGTAAMALADQAAPKPTPVAAAPAPMNTPPPPPPPSAAPAAPVAPAKPLVAPPGVAATVDGENISTDDVKTFAYQVDGANVVNTLIMWKLLDQAAARSHIEVTSADVDAKKKEIADQLKPRTLDDVIKQSHLTMDFVNNKLHHDIEAEKLASVGVTNTKMLHIHHLLIKVSPAGMAPTGTEKQHTDAEAKALIAKIQGDLKAGKKFDDLAKQYSEDPSNKDSGGDLGIVDESTSFDPNFLKAALALKKGEVTAEPAKSVYGYHLIQCVSTSDDHPASENDQYADAAKRYKTTQINRTLPTFMQSLREKAKIVNYLGQ